jgi:DNA-binding XRE family transcriptional regulator
VGEEKKENARVMYKRVYDRFEELRWDKSNTEASCKNDQKSKLEEEKKFAEVRSKKFDEDTFINQRIDSDTEEYRKSLVRSNEKDYNDKKRIAQSELDIKKKTCDEFASMLAESLQELDSANKSADVATEFNIENTIQFLEECKNARAKFSKIISDSNHIFECFNSFDGLYGGKGKQKIEDTAQTLEGKDFYEVGQALLGKKLERKRKIKGIQQEHLAEAADVTRRVLINTVGPALKRIIFPKFFDRMRNPKKTLLRIGYAAILIILLLYILSKIIGYIAYIVVGVIGLVALSLVVIACINLISKLRLKNYIIDLTVSYYFVSSTDSVIKEISTYLVKKQMEESGESLEHFIERVRAEAGKRKETALAQVAKLETEVKKSTEDVEVAEKTLADLENAYKNTSQTLATDTFNAFRNEQKEKLSKELQKLKSDFENEVNAEAMVLQANIDKLDQNIKAGNIKILELENQIKEQVEICKNAENAKIDPSFKPMNYKFDDYYTLGFSNSINNEPAKMVAVQHHMESILFLYDASDTFDNKEKFKTSMREFLKALTQWAVLINTMGLCKMHFVDLFYNGAFLSDSPLKHEKVRILDVLTEQGKASELLKTLTEEGRNRKQIEQDNIERYKREDSPAKYNILLLFEANELLKDKALPPLFRNNNDYGILPIIFLKKQEVDDVEKMKSVANKYLLELYAEIEKNKNCYLIDLNKDFLSDGYIIPYDLKPAVDRLKNLTFDE